MTDHTVRVQITAPIAYETEVYRVEPAGDCYPQNLYDVPADQYARWTTAWAAWEACQEDMAAILHDPDRQELNTPDAAHAWRRAHGYPCCVDKRTRTWATECQMEQP